jgi:hypothetical protein
MCYGTGECRGCDGTGVALTVAEKWVDGLLWVWFMCWWGIFGGFLGVGFSGYSDLTPGERRPSQFSLALLIITTFLWVILFVADGKIRAGIEGRKSRHAFGSYFMLTGTILAIFTLLGIFFLVYIAPRIQP